MYRLHLLNQQIRFHHLNCGTQRSYLIHPAIHSHRLHCRHILDLHSDIFLRRLKNTTIRRRHHRRRLRRRNRRHQYPIRQHLHRQHRRQRRPPNNL